MTLLNQAAPEFTLLTTKLEPLKLSELRGKTVVLAFYPAAFSGICDNEMCTFQSNLSRLNDANAVVVGISPDSPFANAFATVGDAVFVTRGLLTLLNDEAQLAAVLAHELAHI